MPRLLGTSATARRLELSETRVRQLAAAPDSLAVSAVLGMVPDPGPAAALPALRLRGRLVS
jgi:hypothetical protein